MNHRLFLKGNEAAAPLSAWSVSVLILLICASVVLSLAATGSQAQSGQPDTREAPQKPSLFIIGDSTVRNGNADGVGWGEVIAQHFDTDRIDIHNRAIAGRSSRTFRLEGRWEKVLQEAKPGDFVMIQFGHNDGANPTDAEKPRGSLRGMGDETVTWHHPQLDREETIHTYGWYMRQYVKEAKEKGLIPIVLSYVPRAPRRGQEMQTELDDMYGTWSRQVAEQTDAAFINLYGRIAREYTEMEAQRPHSVKERFFVGGDRDYTHTVRAGAELNARKLVEGIRDLEGDAAELAEYLKESPATQPVGAAG